MEVHDAVDGMAWLLEAVHSSSGLPWWALVPLASITLRATIGAMLLRQHRIARHRWLGPLAPQLANLSQEALAQMSLPSSSPRVRLEALSSWLTKRRRLLRQCQASHLHRNAYVYTHVGIVVLQLMGLRYAVSIDPSFAYEGVLWAPSLAEHDPYLRFLLASTTISLVALGRPPPAGMGGMAGRLGYWASVLGTVVLVPIAHFASIPEAVALHFLGSALYRFSAWAGRGTLALLATKKSGRISTTTGMDQPRNPRW